MKKILGFIRFVFNLHHLLVQFLIVSLGGARLLVPSLPSVPHVLPWVGRNVLHALVVVDLHQSPPTCSVIGSAA